MSKTTRYYSGTYFESLTKNWLERNGYYVMRSAGSKGVFDLIATPIHNKVISADMGWVFVTDKPLYIQLKSISFTTLLEGNTLNAYLNSKSLIEFRDIVLNGIEKYLIIYNSEHKTESPIIYLFKDYTWTCIYNSRNKL